LLIENYDIIKEDKQSLLDIARSTIERIEIGLEKQINITFIPIFQVILQKIEKNGVEFKMSG